MIKNKRKAIPNFFIALVLVAGISWVCGRFVYLNDVEFTDNAKIQQQNTTASDACQYPCTRIYQENLLRRIPECKER